MKGVAVPVTGFADICAAEASELTRADAKIAHGLVFFDVQTVLDICSYIYRAQTPIKVLQFVSEGTLSDLKSIVEKTDWSFLNGTFVVRAEAPDRQELEMELGGMIVQKTGAKVSLSNPDITVFLIVRGGHAIIGIDLCGEDLGKRDYRVFLGPEALKGTIAASLVRFAGVKEPFVDFFCRSGVIPIEAALLVTKRSPHYFGKEKFLFRKLPSLATIDWDAFFLRIDEKVKDDAHGIIAMDPEFRNISAAKKNAKIAGIIKSLDFSRTDLEFLDAKFGKKAVSTIVTLPPQISNVVPAAKAAMIAKDILYQAEFVLKTGGTCVMITLAGVPALKQVAADFKFTLQEERIVQQGETVLTVLVFRR